MLYQKYTANSKNLHMIFLQYFKTLTKLNVAKVAICKIKMLTTKHAIQYISVSLGVVTL